MRILKGEPGPPLYAYYNRRVLTRDLYTYDETQTLLNTAITLAAFSSLLIWIFG